MKTYEKLGALPSNESLSMGLSPRVYLWRRAASYLVETFSRRLVLVKQIPTKEDKIHVFLYSQPHNLLEGVDQILPAYWVALHVPNMVVRCEQNSYRILGSCELFSTTSYIEISQIAYIQFFLEIDMMALTPTTRRTSRNVLRLLVRLKSI